MANLGCEALRSQDGESFFYFAYGSNLLTERIHLRNPSAVFYSVARLQVICMGAKENGLPLEYQKKLNAIEPNDYKGKVSEEIEDIIKKGEAKTH
ncbi:gamma-glutamylcyclotransferase isoform X4 [Capricornis sumatraensis]|uniref:gamma-glutamylcyclotransferase isoform X4 n=1 Tax=Capricornis sumatraensis TaxID=34865 RepID=UPI0036046DF4